MPDRKSVLLQAVEALKETRRVDEFGRHPDTHWESLRDMRRSVIAQQDAAVAALEAAIGEQGEPPLSVARIAEIGKEYPWEISLVWHVAVPDLEARGVVVDALLYVDPPGSPPLPLKDEGEVRTLSQTEPLTSEQAMRVVINACDSLNITRVHELGGKTTTICDEAGLLEIVRAIEAAHGIDAALSAKDKP